MVISDNADEVSMSVLVFIRELSFRVKKVLDNKLEDILSAVFSLLTNTKNESLRKESIYTLRTVAKYSSDVRMLYFILMMPLQMFTKYKIPNSYCINFIMQKEHLNICVLEEELLEMLVKVSSELFADAHQVVNDLGEEIVVNIFKRFMDRKKADVYLKMVKVHVSKKRAEQILKFLKLNFENIEDIVMLGGKIQSLEVGDAFDDRANIFRASGQMFISQKSVGREESGGLKEEASGDKKRGFQKEGKGKEGGMVDRQQGEKMKDKRNHRLQDDLMSAIHQLINT